MSKMPNDINDDEIRIISAENSKPPKKDSLNRMVMPPTGCRLQVFWMLIIAAVIIATIIFFFVKNNEDTEEADELDFNEIVNEAPIDGSQTHIDSIVPPAKGYVETYDTIINKIPLTVFIPQNSVPQLHVGVDILQDTTAVLVVQAADIRRDNGQILGAFVTEGNLLSRGQSKAGFCAIINGKIVLGVADSTPYLEQAIETGGDFFRQYPLVVGGQVVENKLKPSSLRKALAELNGEIVVIMSHKKQHLNDFSQTLVDLGVTNAIYLIGSTAYGFAKEKDGNRLEFGMEYDTPSVNSNYIIWK